MNIFKAIKYLLRDISPVRVSSATADLEPIEKEYKPQEVALDIEEAQQKVYKKLLVEVVELVHKTSINSLTAQIYLDYPKVALLYEQNPDNEALQNRINYFLKDYSDSAVSPDELGKKILTLIYEEFPSLNVISNKVFNG